MQETNKRSQNTVTNYHSHISRHLAQISFGTRVSWKVVSSSLSWLHSCCHNTLHRIACTHARTYTGTRRWWHFWQDAHRNFSSKASVFPRLLCPSPSLLRTCFSAVKARSSASRALLCQVSLSLQIFRSSSSFFDTIVSSSLIRSCDCCETWRASVENQMRIFCDSLFTRHDRQQVLIRPVSDVRQGEHTWRLRSKIFCLDRHLLSSTRLWAGFHIELWLECEMWLRKEHIQGGNTKISPGWSLMQPRLSIACQTNRSDKIQTFGWNEWYLLILIFIRLSVVVQG